jgi:predicted homoserine dehydrogenase-like protein
MTTRARSTYLDLYKLGRAALFLLHALSPVPFRGADLDRAGGRFRRHGAGRAGWGAIRVEVVATAKTDLKAGQVLDGFGGFLTYGE